MTKVALTKREQRNLRGKKNLLQTLRRRHKRIRTVVNKQPTVDYRTKVPDYTYSILIHSVPKVFSVFLPKAEIYANSSIFPIPILFPIRGPLY